MCNEYAREIALAKFLDDLAKARQTPFAWKDGRIPNDLDAKPSLKIRDPGLVLRLSGDTLVGEMLPWAWRGPNGKPVFNFRSEGRDFSASDRVLILATGFYEHSAPRKPGVKLMDRFFFTMRDHPWHWIAGIVKDDAFTMLTTEPGPDVAPYHKRSIVALTPDAGAGWLTLDRPAFDVFAPPPSGTFEMTPLRRDGASISQDRATNAPGTPGDLLADL
ncbi:SOS response-associated peptidase family protein [Brevundimonas sp.]|uniref:SOS response-associated peptidase family protein n=1 Tax=Brevundimonas sp. TaxID=1871086 RepID=UPI0028A9A820|nr:SOS response-associated peptidase family protein [Brevundimonas sp.]